MATFELGKRRDDLQAPILIAEDWYTVEISREPYESKNRKWKDGGEDRPAEEIEGAGKNIVVNMRVVSDIPEAGGRQLTKWLALPNPSDAGRFTNDGQPMEDWKLDSIYKWVEAFQGEEEGANVSLAQGAKAQVYVIQAIGMDGETMENSISMNMDPRPISGSALGGDEGEGLFGLGDKEDEAPF